MSRTGPLARKTRLEAEEITTPKNPKVACQILDVHGERFVLLRETPDDVMDMADWESGADDTPTLTPEQEAERRARFEAWERRARQNPPKRAG